VSLTSHVVYVNRLLSIAYAGLRSKTSPEGYSIFLSYESSMCKTEMEYPRVPFSNASQRGNFSPGKMTTLAMSYLCGFAVTGRIRPNSVRGYRR